MRLKLNTYWPTLQKEINSATIFILQSTNIDATTGKSYSKLNLTMEAHTDGRWGRCVRPLPTPDFTIADTNRRFSHANQKLRLFTTETLQSFCGPVFIAPCVLVLQALESDHEKFQARHEFTAFSHKDGSTSNSLESWADSWPPEVHISPRSHEHFLEQSVPKSASRSRQTWLFRYT